MTRDARQEGYWSDLADSETSVMDLLRQELEDLEEPETLVGAVTTGEDESEGLLYVLAASRKVRDGNLLLTLRYATVDRGDREARLSSNRIRMRMQGSLDSALPVLFAAVRDGAATDDDPLTLDARNPDGVDHNGALLREPFAEDPDAERKERAERREGRDPRLHESVEEAVTGPTVECENCGAEARKADCLNIGGGIGVDVWVHESCPQDDENGGA
jgi:hypothetical protein